MYAVQFFAACIGSIVILISLPADGFQAGVGLTFFGIQHVVAMIAPICCYPCFFTTHVRVDRVFKWVRTKFFASIAWLIVKIIFLIFLTPGVYGIQVMIAYHLKGRASIARKQDHNQLVAV
jgi:hypothetical protein